MNFIIYENALPVLEEYSAGEALKILLNRHEEFGDEIIELISQTANSILSTDNPQLVYACYVNAVSNLRAHNLIYEHKL